MTGAVRPNTPIGAVHRIHQTSLIRAALAASASSSNRVRAGSASVPAAAATSALKTMSGSSDPEVAAAKGLLGHQAHQKVDESRELRCLMSRRGRGRDGGGEAEPQPHHPHADEDRRHQRDPEEHQRQPAEPPCLARLAQPRHAGEDDGHHQRHDDHPDGVQEERAERCRRGGDRAKPGNACGGEEAGRRGRARGRPRSRGGAWGDTSAALLVRQHLAPNACSGQRRPLTPRSRSTRPPPFSSRAQAPETTCPRDTYRAPGGVRRAGAIPSAFRETYLQSTLTLSTCAVIPPFALTVMCCVSWTRKLLPGPLSMMRKLLT